MQSNTKEFSRRDALKFGSPVGISSLVPVSGFASEKPPESLTAKLARVQLAPSQYPATEVWSFDGTVPGSLIRVAQGEQVSRRFVNQLPEPSSVHWHGVRIVNAMDGVSGLTQDPVPSGAHFDYTFTPKDAGTYWYHSHTNSVEQVARGLYGPLIVDELEPVDVDQDEILVLDDWLLYPETAQIDPDFLSPHDRSHAGRRGNYVAVNGEAATTIAVKKNQRLRLRLINAANARIFQLSVSGLEGWVMALDGMPLPEPEAITDPLLLAPGQRVDLFVDVTADSGQTADLVWYEDQEGYSLVQFTVDDENSGPRRTTMPSALPPNPDMDVPNWKAAKQFDLHMEGGAMGGLRSAEYNGQTLGFRGMIAENQFWAFNGVVGMTDTPLAELSAGETARVKIRNDSMFPHAMHLHGMHFREIYANGELGPLRDTLLMFGDDVKEIAFVAKEPGKWIFHCHMLEHTASGMATWIHVA